MISRLPRRSSAAVPKTNEPKIFEREKGTLASGIS
jgi:hypothetical protein